jgi:hypothetical protein
MDISIMTSINPTPDHPHPEKPMDYPHCSRIRTGLLSTLFIVSFMHCGGAATVTLTPADGRGADAYTDSNQTTTAYGATDPNRLLVRRANTKAYLRFDLAAFEGAGKRGRIIAAELRMQQVGNPLRLEEAMEVFGVNLNYDFSTDGAEGRLGIDWDPAELTHANAPASGAGGSVSVANSRSIRFGVMDQSPDGAMYAYAEDSSMEETPFLDYLNGASGFSSRATDLRALIVAEAPDQGRNTKIFTSADAGSPGLAPALTITYEEREWNIWAAFPVTGEHRASPHGWINEAAYPVVWFYSAAAWVAVDPYSSGADGWHGYDFDRQGWISGSASHPEWVYRHDADDPGWERFIP